MLIRLCNIGSAAVLSSHLTIHSIYRGIKSFIAEKFRLDGTGFEPGVLGSHSKVTEVKSEPSHQNIMRSLVRIPLSGGLFTLLPLILIPCLISRVSLTGLLRRCFYICNESWNLSILKIDVWSEAGSNKHRRDCLNMNKLENGP